MRADVAAGALASPAGARYSARAMISSAPSRIEAIAAAIEPTVKARVLAQALPYLRRYSGQTVLVKYGMVRMGLT